MTDTTQNQVRRKLDRPPLPSKILDVLAEWALYASTALIIMGISQPSIMKPNYVGLMIEYNLWGLVETLIELNLFFLGMVVVFFSGVFPLTKTLVAAIIFRRGRWKLKEI